MESADHPGVQRAAVDAAIAQNDAVGARAALERLWRAQPGPATANFLLGRAAQLPTDPYRRKATLAILRSFTVEPLVAVVRAAASINRIDLDVHLGDFGTYGQDMLDPARPVHSGWNPDVVIVAVQTRDVLPELWERFAELAPEDIDKACDQVIDQFTGLIEGFRRLNDATLVLHGFEEPGHAALGIADRGAARSQRATIRQLNTRLGELADSHRDVYILDYDGLVARAGRSRWHDHHKWQAMKMPIRSEHLVDVADEWLRFVQPAIGRIAKALVVDLDDTLWAGILGEDGIDGIQVEPGRSAADHRALQRSLLDIRARGVLLGVCSKNNYDEAYEALTSHPDMLLRPDSFAAIRINWESKVDNLRSIADELSIGLDSIAFLDDSPFECDLVRRALPEVTVIELDQPPTADANPVAGNPLFERLRLVAEDRARAHHYAQQGRRREALERSDSLETYLHSLGTIVTVSLATSGEVARVAQLTQKTNQFNLTTRRYNEHEVSGFVASDDFAVFVARAEDRFGDHGLVGVLIARITGARWIVDTMLLSCRVIGRGVETAMMSVVAEHAERAGALTIEGTYVPTAKNAPARDFFSDVGFQPAVDEVNGRTGGGSTTWRWPVGSRRLERPPWVRVVDGGDGAAQ